MGFLPIEPIEEPWKMRRIARGCYESRDGLYQAVQSGGMRWQLWKQRDDERGPRARRDSVAKRFSSIKEVREWVRQQYA